MDYKGHKLYLQNKDGKFEEFTYEMAIETMIGQTQVIDELQNKIKKVRQIIDRYTRVVDYDDEISMNVLFEIEDILAKEENNETSSN